jgi:acetylornithine deacetylase/succinyl-diaminopimelate desuccinylase-like protein
LDEPAVFGQGVSQNKVHQAVMLAVLRLMKEADVQLRGRLYWAVNNEGRSSHACSYRIIDALEGMPGFCVVQFPTVRTIGIGNRGRVDVEVHLRGQATHSSAPEQGQSAIEAARQVLDRVAALRWPEAHPQLGRRQAIAYKLRFEPVAPHTLPSDAFMTFDRRLLPGDDPDEAVGEIRQAIGDLSPYQLDVSSGPVMLPWIVERDQPGVAALAAAHVAVHGQEPGFVYRTGTFDAGGPAARGIPTVMYGTARGDFPVGTDAVTVRDAVDEARVLARFILGELL